MNINEIWLQKNCSTPAIDSMSILTPLDLFRLPENFITTLITYNEETGEIIDTKNRPTTFEEFGIKIRMEVRNLFGSSFLCCVVSSKFLQNDYFKGISAKNFYQVFTFYKNAIGFEIPYLEFLNASKVFDVDIKIDFEISDKQFHNFIFQHKKLPTVKMYKNSNHKFLDKALYNGMQFVNRLDASIGKPFVKFYTKQDELQNRSAEFAQTYGITCNANLRRFEVTIKNSASFNALDVSNMLHSILNLEPFKLMNICIHYYNQHFPKDYIHAIPKNLCKLSLQDWTTCATLYALMESDKTNRSLSTLLSEFVGSYPSISVASKSRKIRQLKNKMKQFTELQDLFDLTRYSETTKDYFNK